MEEETSSQPHKPFFSLYAKKRHRFNLMRFIFGEYKYGWFEECKQPIKYKNAFDLAIDSIDLDVKDITFTPIEEEKIECDHQCSSDCRRNGCPCQEDHYCNNSNL